MRYAQIRDIDIANGPGIRVSLYVQGCHTRCPFCFNPETWDFSGGKAYTPKQEEDIIALVKRPHIKGFTILGGEPMDPENREEVYHLLKKIKKACPDKSIWMYSSYLYEDILNFDQPVLDYVDVLVDGPFINELKDLKLKFRGSSNQRLVDVQASLKNEQVILYELPDS